MLVGQFELHPRKATIIPGQSFIWKFHTFPTHPPTHPPPPPPPKHTHPGSSSSVLYRHSRGLLCQTDTRLASIMPWQTSKNLDRFTLEIQRTFVVKPRCKTITLLCKESSENILRIPLKVRAISARIIY